MAEEKWHVADHSPLVEDQLKGMPYVVVSHVEGLEPVAHFAKSSTAAETIRQRQHETIWRAFKKFSD